MLNRVFLLFFIIVSSNMYSQNIDIIDGTEFSDSIVTSGDITIRIEGNRHPYSSPLSLMNYGKLWGYNSALVSFEIEYNDSTLCDGTSIIPKNIYLDGIFFESSDTNTEITMIPNKYWGTLPGFITEDERNELFYKVEKEMLSMILATYTFIPVIDNALLAEIYQHDYYIHIGAEGMFIKFQW